MGMLAPMPVEKVLFDTSDGVRLEGRLALPEQPSGAAVLCHPHPQYEGSMSSALIPLIQRALEASGWASLRFNFRGVRLSEGRYGKGIDEVKDVTAAMARASDAVPDRPLAVAGWSFGALVGLAAAVADARVRSYVGIAPPISVAPHMDLSPLPSPERLEGWDARVLGLCGTADDFCRPEDLRGWVKAVSPNGQSRVFPGADHFFSSAREELADEVAAFIAGG
jgi:alpha/beta superfamily hydrolase